jgi:hypothetical protein
VSGNKPSIKFSTKIGDIDYFGGAKDNHPNGLGLLEYRETNSETQGDSSSIGTSGKLIGYWSWN